MFIYRLSGDVDQDSTADNGDLLYGGMWLHTPDGGDTEVIAFTDAFGGELISDDNLHPLNFKATYGDVDDGTPEASGYYVNPAGEASTFFADAVLSVDFGSVSEYGNIEGTVSNDGDYEGPEFTLNLETATNAGSGEDGLYKGDTVGETGDPLIDEDWQGEWGAKFFGLYGANVPDFVHGTFGARDTDPTDARSSILGFFLAQLDPNTAPEPPSVDPTVANVDQFVAANKETSTAVPDTCDMDPAICDSSPIDDRGVYQHAAQNPGFSVLGVQVVLNNLQYSPILHWQPRQFGGFDTSTLELEDEHTREFYGKNYYHLEKAESGSEETNEVFIYRLSGNIDPDTTDDDDDWLYGGMWLHTPAAGMHEVIAFTDTYGEVISDDKLEELYFSATYGAVDDGTPEASGYYVNPAGEASTFFADAVLSVDFGLDQDDYGNIKGTVSNEGDYEGPEFTLNLETATNAGSGEDGLYTGDTVGETGGTLIDDDWEGDWGAKFFGLYTANAPDFVHGTFGAADTDPTDAKSSILGFFLAQLNPGSAVDFSILSPPIADNYLPGIKASSAAAPATCSKDNDKCGDTATDDRSVYQHAMQVNSVQGVRFSQLPNPDNFRAVLYWNDGSDGNTAVDFDSVAKSELYGKDYYSKEIQDSGDSNAFHSVQVNRLSGNVDQGSGDDDGDWLYGGIWVRTPPGAGTQVEVIAFTDTYGEVISDDNLRLLDFTATYGAVDDGTPEATGHYVDADGDVSPIYADAVLMVDFTAIDGDYGRISGTVSNNGDYYGPEFTLNLETATNAGSDQDGLYTGDTVGETGGTLIDDDWEGAWGAKFFGLHGNDVPEFVHGTFGARDTDPTDATSSILGYFLAQLDPDTAPERSTTTAPVDYTVVYPDPADAAKFAEANEETSTEAPELCSTSVCVDHATNDLGVYQHAVQNDGDNFEVQGVQFNSQPVLYWTDDTNGDSSSTLALGDENLLELYGNSYYHLINAPAGMEANEVFIYRLSGDTDSTSNTDDSDWLYGGMWLHTPDGGDTEVIVFADAFGSRAPITETQLRAITGAGTYGAEGDGVPEASGYYVSPAGEESTFFADAVITANFDARGGIVNSFGSVSGSISNQNDDYHGPNFRLNLVAAVTNDGRGGLYRGSSIGASTAPITGNWFGDWGVKFFGLDGTSAPDFVYGTFGAEDLVGSTGSIVGSFLAPRQP